MKRVALFRGLLGQAEYQHISKPKPVIDALVYEEFQAQQ